MKKIQNNKDGYDAYVLQSKDKNIGIEIYWDVEASYNYFHSCTLRRRKYKLDNIALFALKHFKSISAYLHEKGHKIILKEQNEEVFQERK